MRTFFSFFIFKAQSQLHIIVVFKGAGAQVLNRQISPLFLINSISTSCLQNPIFKFKPNLYPLNMKNIPATQRNPLTPDFSESFQLQCGSYAPHCARPVDRDRLCRSLCINRLNNAIRIGKAILKDESKN